MNLSSQTAITLELCRKASPLPVWLDTNRSGFLLRGRGIMMDEQLTPGQKAARTRKLMDEKMTPGQKAAQTRKRKKAGVKASIKKKQRAAGRKAAETRRRNKGLPQKKS
jgi:hypothetical protein